MVLAELRPSICSENPPDTDGEVSRGEVSRADSGGLVGTFMLTRTDAASRSWTCWCLEMSSLEVKDHSGVCSHLKQRTSQQTVCLAIFNSGGWVQGAGRPAVEDIMSLIGEGEDRGTNKCLVKQLLCLYPFPQC